MTAVPLGFQVHAGPADVLANQAIEDGPAATESFSLLEAGQIFGQSMLGAMMLVLGAALTLTLWLMPIGVPVGLLGLALLSAPSEG